MSGNNLTPEQTVKALGEQLFKAQEQTAFWRTTSDNQARRIAELERERNDWRDRYQLMRQTHAEYLNGRQQSPKELLTKAVATIDEIGCLSAGLSGDFVCCCPVCEFRAAAIGKQPKSETAALSPDEKLATESIQSREPVVGNSDSEARARTEQMK